MKKNKNHNLNKAACLSLMLSPIWVVSMLNFFGDEDIGKYIMTAFFVLSCGLYMISAAYQDRGEK